MSRLWNAFGRMCRAGLERPRIIQNNRIQNNAMWACYGAGGVSTFFIHYAATTKAVASVAAGVAWPVYWAWTFDQTKHQHCYWNFDRRQELDQRRSSTND